MKKCVKTGGEKKSKRTQRDTERERESKDKFLATMTGLVFVCLSVLFVTSAMAWVEMGFVAAPSRV